MNYVPGASTKSVEELIQAPPFAAPIATSTSYLADCTLFCIRTPVDHPNDVV